MARKMAVGGDREEYETEGTKWVDGDVIKNKTCPWPGIKKRKCEGSYVVGIENVSVEEASNRTSLCFIWV